MDLEKLIKQEIDQLPEFCKGNINPDEWIGASHKWVNTYSDLAANHNRNKTRIVKLLPHQICKHCHRTSAPYLYE